MKKKNQKTDVAGSLPLILQQKYKSEDLLKLLNKNQKNMLYIQANYWTNKLEKKNQLLSLHLSQLQAHHFYCSSFEVKQWRYV